MNIPNLAAVARLSLDHDNPVTPSQDLHHGRAASPLPTLLESPPCSPGSTLSSNSADLSHPSYGPFDALHSRSRARSPSSRTAAGANPAVAPLMARTRSLPSVGLAGSLAPSPSHSPVREASPLRAPPRRSLEDVHSLMAAPPSFMDIESIAEDVELFLPPRPGRGGGGGPLEREPGTRSPSLGYSSGGSLARGSRRRPPSPLHHPPPSPSPVHAQMQMHPLPLARSASPATRLPPAPPSPGFGPVRFNEPYPGAGFSLSATSSIPSTPTSLRSRSPSISSLETIPDSPDAEEAAIEAFNIARLKVAADDDDASARASAAGVGDVSRVGFAGLGRDKRKRWSVCGAERRGDFEMETIWED